MVADGCQNVAECGFVFGIPLCLANWQAVWIKHFGHDDQAEDAEQAGCGTFNGSVRPLTLGLETEICSQFFKSDFDVPASDHPGQDVLCTDCDVRAEEGRWLEAILWTAHQYPADGNRRRAAMIPQRHTGDELDLFRVSTVPGDLGFLPTGLRVNQSGSQARLSGRVYPWVLSQESRTGQRPDAGVKPDGQAT